MLEAALAALDDVTVVKANAAEAIAFTGERGREARSAALRPASSAPGAEAVLVTAGDAAPCWQGRLPARSGSCDPGRVRRHDRRRRRGRRGAAPGSRGRGELTPESRGRDARSRGGRVVSVRGALTGLPARGRGRDMLGVGSD